MPHSIHLPSDLNQLHNCQRGSVHAEGDNPAKPSQQLTLCGVDLHYRQDGADEKCPFAVTLSREA
jgi:hypothetical protein